MIIAVLDTSAVASGIGWAGAPRRVLALLAARAFRSVRTPDLTAEWFGTVSDLASTEPRWRNPNWEQWLNWLCRKSPLMEPTALGKTVKRDPDDDIVLAAALGGRAQCLVSYDNDLLDLGKPFGVQVLRPEAFLSTLLRSR